MHKRIATLSVAPGAFNINETVIFGLPIMLNPFYFIPFILVQPLLGMLTYGAHITGWVNPAIVVVPWTTPFIVSGFLATLDVSSITLSFILLVVAILIYMPFVILDINATKKQMSVTKDSSNEALLDDESMLMGVINKVFRKDIKTEIKEISNVEDDILEKTIKAKEEFNKKNKIKGKSGPIKKYTPSQLNKLTKDQLMKELDRFKIKYSKSMKKEELIYLAKKNKITI